MPALQPTSAPLQDFFALHVCSRLRLSDLLSLGQTCKAFCQLVFNNLPDSTFEAVAVNQNLPDHHSCSTMAGDEVRQYLQRVARAKRELPRPTSVGARPMQHTALVLSERDRAVRQPLELQSCIGDLVHVA